MGVPRKKGAAGSAVNYMTRNQAVKKLQLSLPEFRKLCILKGIHPRDPAKKASGTGKTYYLAKDLRFMMHDPLVEKFREHRAWTQKLKKAKARKLTDKVANLIKNEPQYTLIHLIKERYPTFMDAIRDLDDAVTMIHLFTLMPTKHIKPKRVENCRRLSLEFQYYIIKTHALRKVFISIKGIYFQAEIFGQKITWIVPHKFNQRTSKDVDYTVMLTFLEFHEVLMGFVNYKLFNSIGMKYPLLIDEKKDEAGEHLKAITAEPLGSNNAPTVPKKVLKAAESRIHSLDDLMYKISLQDAKAAAAKGEMEVDDEQTESTNAAAVAEEEQGDIFDEDARNAAAEEEAFKSLFANCVFYLSREVPRENLEFIIRAFGGQVSWDGGSIPEDSNKITHQVVDRGIEPNPRRVEREYIQPQWIFDSVNARVLLPVDIYGPTAKLPPHLSPFVDTEMEGYVPDFQKKIEEYIAQARGGSAPASINLEEEAPAEESEESEDDEAVYARELAAEKKGKYAGDESSGEEESEEEQAEEEEAEEAEETWVDPEDAYMAKHAIRNSGIKRKYDNKKKRTAAEREEEEAQQMAQAMLPNKKRKLLEHLQRGQRRGQDRVYTLEEKKAKLANKTLEVGPDGILIKKKK